MKLDNDYMKEQSFNIVNTQSMFLLDNTKVLLSKDINLAHNIGSQQRVFFRTKSIPFIIESSENRDIFKFKDKHSNLEIDLAPSYNVTGSAFDFVIRLLNSYKMNKGVCSFLICCDYIIKDRKCYRKLYNKLYREVGVMGYIHSKACEWIAKLLLATPFSLLGMRLYIMEFDLKATLVTGKVLKSLYAVDIPYSSNCCSLLKKIMVKDIHCSGYYGYMRARQNFIRDIAYKGWGNSARVGSQYLKAVKGKTNDYIIESDCSYGRLGTLGHNLDLEIKEYDEDKIRKILEESFII